MKLFPRAAFGTRTLRRRPARGDSGRSVASSAPLSAGLKVALRSLRCRFDTTCSNRVEQGARLARREKE